MDFTGKLTPRGAELLAQCLATETPLTVTRVVAGSGATDDSAEALAQPRQEVPISTRTSNGALATIMATVAASQAEEAYSLTELGVYARDPAGQELLYQLFRLDVPIDISPNSRLVLRAYLRMAVSDELKVELELPPSGLLIEEDLCGKADLVDGQVPYAQASHLTRYTTLYVDGNLGDDANPGTQQAPFRTVQAAVDSLPRDLGGTFVRIRITGDVVDTEKISICGFYGGEIQLIGEVGATRCWVALEAYYCTAVALSGIIFNSAEAEPFMVYLSDCAKAGISNCTFSGTESSRDGIQCTNQTNLGVSSCIFNNLKNAINTESTSATRGVATVSVYDCCGKGNSVVIYCTNSAICVEYYKTLEQIGADTTVIKSNGGIVFRQDGTLYAG